MNAIPAEMSGLRPALTSVVRRAIEGTDDRQFPT